MVFLGTICWLRQVVLMSIWRRSRMLKEGEHYVVPVVLKHDTNHVILPVYLFRGACCWNHSFLSILCSLWVIISLHMHIKRLQAGFFFPFFWFPQLISYPCTPWVLKLELHPSPIIAREGNAIWAKPHWPQDYKQLFW